MRGMRAWFLRLKNFFGRSRDAEKDFAAEMQSNLQLHIDENLQRGMGMEEARRNALMRLGGVAQTEEMVRDRRSLPWLESFTQDFRFAVRMLLKNPGFTLDGGADSCARYRREHRDVQRCASGAAATTCLFAAGSNRPASHALEDIGTHGLSVRAGFS